MKFRTEYEQKREAGVISHDRPIALMGSCFTDNIGSRLLRDGFDADVNSMGALYNPLSICQAIAHPYPFTLSDLVTDANGVFHCLFFESKRQNPDAQTLLNSLNDDFARWKKKLEAAEVWIVTFGTAWVFERQGLIVGNCHKFDSREFIRRRLSVNEIVDAWRPLCRERKVIFTISPIRHLADGLHGNALSKATLFEAVEQLADVAGYFGAYEIMNDDLRDYRFYAADMLHPSEVAVDYIYDKFQETYFTEQTRQKAAEARREAARAAHRPILCK